jgi:hypothetical protein
MPFAPVFSVAVPLIGLLTLVVVARVPRLRPCRRFIVPAAAGLSFIGVCFAPLGFSRAVVLYRLQPSIFFGAFPSFLAESGVWLLALAFSCAVVAGALVQMGRVAEPRFSLGVSTLGMLAAGLTGLWGENLLVVLVAWACFDLAWGLGAAAAGLPARRVVLGVGVNGLATVALWAGALVVEGGGGGLSWRLMAPTGLGGDLLLAAGALRLGLYPLHLALPVESRERLPGAAVLLLGPLLGWGLLAQLAVAGGGVFAAGPWLEGLAATTFIGGGLLAWTCNGVRKGWPWASLAVVGEVLWAALRVGDGALSVLAAGGAAWVLGVTLLQLGRGLALDALWWVAASFVGGMALLGAPLTLGLVPSALLTGSLVRPFTVGGAVVFLLGQGLLTAAVARRALRPALGGWPAGPLSVAARAAGLALPVLLLLVGGVHPPLLTRCEGGRSLVGLLTGAGIGWGLWLAGTIAGAVLFWQERRFRQQLEPLLGLVHDFLRLEWVLFLALDSLARAAVFLGTVADMVEGPGAILWALAVFFLVLLALVGR